MAKNWTQLSDNTHTNTHTHTHSTTNKVSSLGGRFKCCSYGLPFPLGKSLYHGSEVLERESGPFLKDEL